MKAVKALKVYFHENEPLRIFSSIRFIPMYIKSLSIINGFCTFESLFDFVILMLKNTVLSGRYEAKKIVLIPKFENY
jgi:hypothetical protein